MKEQEIRRQLKDAFAAAEGNPPPFDAVWAKAEGVSRWRRQRLAGGIAAALAVVIVSLALWPARQADNGDDYLIAASLLNSTSWAAPSDALLPERRFDIYREIHFLDESTNSLEGTLL